MFVSLGSGFAFLGIALGAFGTHALRKSISADSLQNWQTGVQYHLYPRGRVGFDSECWRPVEIQSLFGRYRFSL